MLRVNLGPRSYDIVVVSDDHSGLGPFGAARIAGRKALVVADENVLRIAADVGIALQAAGFVVENATLPSGEATKCLDMLETLYERLAALPADRQTAVVAVGGGVTGDVTGFAAGTYNRGLPLLMVPTTLLAMVDSSVGGKVGINLPQGKNLVGAFHQPVGVWIDTAHLGSLPDREYRSGLAEVVKYGIILDADLFGWLEENADRILAREPESVRRVVTRSCELKAKVVEQDEREETGLRAILNFGHTFAHAFEAVAGYGRILHGEAVAAGMVCATRLAQRRGLIGEELTGRLTQLLSRFGLPTSPPDGQIRDWLTAMRRDKKAIAETMLFILPIRFGGARVFDDVSEIDVQIALDT